MKNICRLTILVALAATFMLSACGKMASPSPIEGSGYPHTYPKR